LQGRCLRADLPRYLDLFSDCLASSRFPPEEVDKQKQVQIAAIAEQGEQPFHVALHALQGALFPGHPYRWDPQGSSSTVARLTVHDLQEQHRKLVVSGNMALAFFGDLDPHANQGLIARALHPVRRDQAPAREYSVPVPSLPVTLQRREPKQQAIILTGFPGWRSTTRGAMHWRCWKAP